MHLLNLKELPVFLLLALCFVYSAKSSGLYMDAFIRQSSKIADKYKDLKDEVKANGTSVPPIEENPHLEEIDEKYSLCNGVDVRELTILQIQEYFDSNELTSEALTRCYIERIEMMNEVLRSVNEVNPAALAHAKKADFERKMGIRNRGPMHGIPVLIKENIATLDEMETTAGALALLGIRPKSDADVVKALRKAGAVILGKANLSEFANFRGTNIPNGWSGRGNHTRNAYNLNADPAGSSSGSAVTVSANLCVVSVGTETDGSLIAPASVNGVFTIKPTLGTPSIKGIIPISHNQDNAGPMARTVMDLAIALDAMIPEEERNPKQPKSFTDRILKRKEGSRPFRIGVMRYSLLNASAINSTSGQEELDQLDELIELLKNSVDFEVLDPVTPDAESLRNVDGIKELIVLKHDFKHDLNEYLRTEVMGPNHLTLKDVIQFNEENPSPEGYNQELLISSEATDGLQNETYIKARDENREAAKGALDSVLEKYDLDAVMAPGGNRYEGSLDGDAEKGTFAVGGYSLAAIAGYPSINIPAGNRTNGVPFGVTFVGVPYSEAILLQVAYAVEQLYPKRFRPEFLI